MTDKEGRRFNSFHDESNAGRKERRKNKIRGGRRPKKSNFDKDEFLRNAWEKAQEEKAKKGK